MILALTKLLLSREATVEQIARRIGGTLERRRTGYWLHPAGPGLSEVWIGIEPAPTGEMLRYVRLRLAPPGVGGLEAFNQAFGPYARMPAEPEGEAFSVRYRCDDASLPYLGRIFVALSAEPSEPLARVTQVTIRREERL